MKQLLALVLAGFLCDLVIAFYITLMQMILTRTKFIYKKERKQSQNEIQQPIGRLYSF